MVNVDRSYHLVQVVTCVCIIVSTLLLIALVELGRDEVHLGLRVAAYVSLELSLQASFVSLNEEVDGSVGQSKPKYVSAIYLAVSWMILCSLLVSMSEYYDDFDGTRRALFMTAAALLATSTLSGSVSYAVLSRRRT